MRQINVLRVVLLSLFLSMLVKLEARAQTPLPPNPDHEFRGVFVATAYNLDWPSRPGLHRKVQRDEIRAVVGRVKELNCNAVLLQVRAFGDRIHRKTKFTKSEPWSPALNHGGDPDKPKLKYDPLAEWIKECHDAGIELHAWVNPFRTDYLIETPPPNPVILPVLPSPDGCHLYLDPTNALVQAYVADVINELLDYDVPNASTIDAILFDHYWVVPPTTQPVTPSSNAGKKARIKWLKKKADKNPPAPTPAATIDQFIEKISNEAHSRGIKFGLSPEYGDAQAKQWLQQGRLNYVIPELYFQDSPQLSFEDKLKEWLQIPYPTADFTPIVVAGLFTARVQAPPENLDDPWAAQVIVDEIGVAQSAQILGRKASGQAHYSWSALRTPQAGGPSDPQNNIGERLEDVYEQPALIPPCTAPPAGTSAPAAPTVTLTPAGAAPGKVSWKHVPPDPNVVRWAVWLRENNQWGKMQVFGSQTQSLDVAANVDRAAVKAIDRYNRESDFGAAP